MLRKILLVSILFITIYVLPSYAQNTGPGRGVGPAAILGKSGMMGKMGMRRRMHDPEMCIQNAKDLDLTEEQESKLLDLHYSHKKNMISLTADKDLKKLELDRLLDADKLDLSTIENTLKEMYDTKIKIKMEKIKTHEAVKEILTKEQQDKMKSMMMDNMMQWKKPMKKRKKRIMDKMGPGPSGDNTPGNMNMGDTP